MEFNGEVRGPELFTSGSLAVMYPNVVYEFVHINEGEEIINNEANAKKSNQAY